MATTAPLDLSVWRNDDVYEFPVRIVGMDLTNAGLVMQIRQGRDLPGPPLVSLAKVTNGNAEGLRVAAVTVEAGVPVSDLRIRLNKSTRQSLPYTGEVGDDTPLEYAMLIGGRTRLAGRIVMLAHAYDSDDAPGNRPQGWGCSARGNAPRGSATLTIAGDDVVRLSIDGADVALSAAERATTAMTAAELAAATALAASRYFPTRAAGEAASATGQLFSTDDGAGNVIYYRRTAGGSTEIGRALTPAALAAPTGASLIGRFASVAALLASNATARGIGLTWQAAEHSYAEAAPDAADHHLTTAGGVKLYVMPAASGIAAEAFGILEANTAAINSPRYLAALAFAGGRPLLFKTGRFRIGATYAGPATILGQGKPVGNAERTMLEGGTIFEGGLTFTGPRVVLARLGCDHGSASFGSASDALDISAAPFNSGRIVILTDVIGLARAIGDDSHAVKVEGYGQVMATNVDGLNGQYCLAIKSRRVTISGSYAAGGSNLWIIKSDGSAVGTGTAGKIFVSGIVGEGVGGTTHGLRLFSDNAAATSINVTGFDIESVDTGIEIEAATRMSDVTIAQGTVRDVRQFGMKASGAIDEISLSAINLIDVATYAAQFLSGRITTRDIYVSMKAGSTAHADDFFRVEPGVVGFSCDNLKMEENRGAGNTVPTLSLQSPRGYNRLSNIDCRIDGNLPLKGFRGQLAVGNSVAISPLIDLDSMHSLVKLDANAAVTVTSIISTVPGGATLPEGYTVTVIPNSGFPYTFVNSAPGGNLNIETGDVARTVNQPIRFEWGGAVWHRV